MARNLLTFYKSRVLLISDIDSTAEGYLYLRYRAGYYKNRLLIGSDKLIIAASITEVSDMVNNGEIESLN